MEGEIFLKKKWILLTAALLLALGGCQGKDETVVQNEEAFREYEVNLSDKLSDFQFAMNEEVYTLPESMEVWKERGWEIPSDRGEEHLEAESFIEGESLKRGEDTLTAAFVNQEGESRTLEDSMIGGVTLEYREGDTVYQLPGKLCLGRATLNQVTEQYGPPTDEYEEKEDVYVTYEFGLYKKAEFVFHIEDETLYRVSLQNYRASQGADEEVSKEEPQAVKEYERPEQFSENPRDYVVSYDNQLYRIPAPVSEFVKHGWKIQEEGSDTYVKPGRHGYVTLEKDGHTLYAVVRNYGEQTIAVKYAFLTSLSGDFDVTKVPVAVGNNITLGMSEENMKILLGGNAFESQEEEKGTSYYLYSDETKKNFVRIFIDKDLGLVREIQVSNSPESLSDGKEEEVSGEEPNSTVLPDENKVPAEE